MNQARQQPAIAIGGWHDLLGKHGSHYSGSCNGDLAIPPDCVINDFLIYAEGPEGGIDLFVDDVVVTTK